MPEACLGIEKSISGKTWQLRLDATGERLAEGLAQSQGISELAGRVLAGRGVTAETAETFLNPTIAQDLPDPSQFKDMDKAAKRLADAIEAGEQVAVFGDYDVDGATSSALLKRYFRQVSEVPLEVYIPDRQREGYGPNTAAMLQLKENGAKVVITVDCGTMSYEPLKAAKDAGLDVIVADHHKAEADLPQAFAIVNPNRVDEKSDFGNLAAVGVTFLLVVALNRELRQRGVFEGRKLPDLLSLLDIVALGTVADVVALTGLNRTFVAQGLKMMAKRQNTGLAALSDVARLDGPPNTYHLGFLLGPRVNAGGRVGESSLGAELLSTEDTVEAKRISLVLDIYNKERQEIGQNLHDDLCPHLIGIASLITVLKDDTDNRNHQRGLSYCEIRASGSGFGRPSQRSDECGFKLQAAQKDQAQVLSAHLPSQFQTIAKSSQADQRIQKADDISGWRHYTVKGFKGTWAFCTKDTNACRFDTYGPWGFFNENTSLARHDWNAWHLPCQHVVRLLRSSHCNRRPF